MMRKTGAQIGNSIEENAVNVALRFAVLACALSMGSAVWAFPTTSCVRLCAGGLHYLHIVHPQNFRAGQRRQSLPWSLSLQSAECRTSTLTVRVVANGLVMCPAMTGAYHSRPIVGQFIYIVT